MPGAAGDFKRRLPNFPCAASRGARGAQFGISTALMTWMTPFDCITLPDRHPGDVTYLTSVIIRCAPRWVTVSGSPCTVVKVASPAAVLDQFHQGGGRVVRR